MNIPEICSELKVSAYNKNENNIHEHLKKNTMLSEKDINFIRPEAALKQHAIS